MAYSYAIWAGKRPTKRERVLLELPRLATHVAIHPFFLRMRAEKTGNIRWWGSCERLGHLGGCVKLPRQPMAATPSL